MQTSSHSSSGKDRLVEMFKGKEGLIDCILATFEDDYKALSQSCDVDGVRAALKAKSNSLEEKKNIGETLQAHTQEEATASVNNNKAATRLYHKSNCLITYMQHRQGSCLSS